MDGSQIQDMERGPLKATASALHALGWHLVSFTELARNDEVIFDITCGSSQMLRSYVAKQVDVRRREKRQHLCDEKHWRTPINWRMTLTKRKDGKG